VCCMLVLFIGCYCLDSSFCCAGGLGDSLTLPIGGQPKIQGSKDPVSLLKDPYATLLEEQDPFRHAARKAIAVVNGSRAKQYMANVANMSNMTGSRTVGAGRIGSSGIGIGEDENAFSGSGMADANMLGMGTDSVSTMSDEGSLESARKLLERRRRKQSNVEADKDDDVGSPKNPASLPSCAPPTCRSESTAALSKLMPLPDK
jgi:hypothetical protein